METAYVTAFAALAGSVIGGLTSLAASWLSQHVQVRAQQLAQDREQAGRALQEGMKRPRNGTRTPISTIRWKSQI